MTSSNQTPSTATDLINWDAAAKIAAQLAPAGPKVSPKKMRAAVESLRYAAIASVDHVYDITGLEAARNLHDSEVLVLDRASWAKANTQSFAVMLAPMLNSSMGKKLQDMTSTQKTIAGYTAASELGGILAFLSTRVLGQYDPYAALAGHGAPGGRLMLLAPNIVNLEKELNVDPEDFRLWVCLHEQTHRVQFAAAPWLRQHMLDLMDRLAQSMGTEDLLGKTLAAAVSAKNSSDQAEETGKPGLVLNESAKQLVSEITAVMSLLEGHANVVMDAVDASIIPTVRTIRQRFNRRSETQKFFTRFISRLLGLNKKMQQYKDGQKFVQFIVDAVGMEAFNSIWASPSNLPSEAEIHDPQLWIDRVLGSSESE